MVFAWLHPIHPISLPVFAEKWNIDHRNRESKDILFLNNESRRLQMSHITVETCVIADQKKRKSSSSSIFFPFTHSTSNFLLKKAHYAIHEKVAKVLLRHKKTQQNGNERKTKEMCEGWNEKNSSIHGTHINIEKWVKNIALCFHLSLNPHQLSRA